MDELDKAQKAYDDAEALVNKLKTDLGKTVPGTAAYKSIQKKYEAAKDDRDDKKNILEPLKEAARTAAKTEKETTAATERDKALLQQSANAQISTLERQYKSAQKTFIPDPNDTNKANAYLDAMAALNSAYTEFEKQGLSFKRLVIQQNNGDIVPAGTSAAAIETPTGVPAGVVAQQQGKAATAATGGMRILSRTERGESTIAEEVKPVVSTTPVVDVAKRKAFVNAQLAARGLENTPANREMLRKEYKTAVAEGKTTEAATVSTAWETIIREQFPAKAWLLDLDRTKYPQLFKVLSTAIAEESYKTPEGRARFEAQLEGTEFYKEISQSKQLKVIQSLVGTLGFQGTDFTKFVSDSINFGYQGEVLKQKVYEQVFKKDDAGNYVNPTALERTKKSADYISTQNIAKAFFNTNPADSDIEKVLTGQMLTADYERQQREFAKTRYGHLSNLLDQGMTLESIASAYKTTASRLLELNPNAIDMSTGAFEQAVTFGEEGKKRLMTNSEWEKLLRTDPQYGWEKTNNAKDEARALSANIAQAFGRIL